jgi:Uma2 family endonuclease
MDIKELRKKKRELGLTNERVCELSGVPLSTVQKAFAGTTSRPREETLLRIERAIIQYEINKKRTVYELKPDDDSWISETNLLELYEEYKAAIPVSDYTISDDVKVPLKKQGEYTLHDFYSMPPDKRVELIDGVMIYMDAPTNKHQLIVKELNRRIDDHIRAKNMDCVTLMAPIDVMLENDNRNMVEPDIIVICLKEHEESDADKMADNMNEDSLYPSAKFINAVPDWVIEVVSPGSRSADLGFKQKKYMSVGVKEYWAVDHEKETIIVSTANEEYIRIYPLNSIVPVSISEGGFSIDFTELIYTVDRQLKIISRINASREKIL